MLLPTVRSGQSQLHPHPFLSILVTILQCDRVNISQVIKVKSLLPPLIPNVSSAQRDQPSPVKTNHRGLGCPTINKPRSALTLELPLTGTFPPTPVGEGCYCYFVRRSFQSPLLLIGECNNFGGICSQVLTKNASVSGTFSENLRRNICWLRHS